MQLTSKTTVKKLLERYNTRPLKRLGQNFLINKAVLQKVIEAADIKKNDVILEIGPGVGTLTQALAERAKKVIAVEKDRKMVEILRETLKDFQNVDIVEGDILKLALVRPLQSCSGRTSASYKLVANLPYYITAPVIRKFLEAENPPKEMILMVQKEVAQRICARPPKMNLLAVSVQFYARPKIISPVSKNSFWPQPKVDSAIIKITPGVKHPMLSDRRETTSDVKHRFFKIVRAGFRHPRKQLANNLSTELKIEKEKVKQWLQKNNIQPQQRAETLTVENWLQLTKTFCYNGCNVADT